MSKLVRLIAVAALLLLPLASTAETMKATLNGSLRLIGEILPIEDGVISVTLISQKTTPVVLLAASDDGEIIWCAGITGPLRTIRCDFTVPSTANVILVGQTSGASVKVDINVEGPADEPIYRPTQFDRQPPAALAAAAEKLLAR